MLKTMLLTMGKDQVIDLMIVGVETLKEMDIDKDSNKDEIAFGIVISFLKTLKGKV